MTNQANEDILLPKIPNHTSLFVCGHDAAVVAPELVRKAGHHPLRHVTQYQSENLRPGLGCIGGVVPAKSHGIWRLVEGVQALWNVCEIHANSMGSVLHQKGDVHTRCGHACGTYVRIHLHKWQIYFGTACNQSDVVAPHLLLALCALEADPQGPLLGASGQVLHVAQLHEIHSFAAKLHVWCLSV